MNTKKSDTEMIRAAMSFLGKRGKGKSKRRAVDYAALARKAHAARAAKKSAHQS